MKKFLVLSALVITSCTLSNEEKAEKLVKETLKDYLYHPDSYEPISTRVDSMFIDVTTIEPIMKISDEIKNLISKINRCERKIESAESSMDIFAPNGYSSQYSRGEYSRAKKEKEEAKSDLNKYTKKLSEQLAFLKENVAKYHKGEFTGWAVSHRFRSLNGAGSMTIPGEMIFFCDEEFTTCGGYETDKFEDFVKILNAVDEATSDEDVIDYFKENNFLKLLDEQLAIADNQNKAIIYYLHAYDMYIKYDGKYPQEYYRYLRESISYSKRFVYNYVRLSEVTDRREACLLLDQAISNVENVWNEEQAKMEPIDIFLKYDNYIDEFILGVDISEFEYKDLVARRKLLEQNLL